MDHALERRLARVERRLAAVELALDEAHIPRPEAVRPTPPRKAPARPPIEPAAERGLPMPPPVPPPPPLPKRAPAVTGTGPSTGATPRAPTPTPSRTAPATPDWERFFGLAVLGRIGVAAVLLAAGYFAQLAYKGLPPIGKVISIYGLAGAFIGVGAWLRPRVASRYVALLWGGGAAAAYLAAIVAHMRFALVGDTVALLLLVTASALGHALARTLRHQTLASMALAGAFAAPLIADASLANGPFLLVYLLLLHAWSAWVEERWDWVGARIVGLVGTGVVVAFWLDRHGAIDVPTYLLLQAYLLGLVAPELIRVVRGRTVGGERSAGVLFGVGIVEAALFIPLLGLVLTGSRAVMTIPLGAGLFWWGLACWLITFAREHANALLVRALARIGGVLTAVGVLMALAALPDGSSWQPETLGVWGTSLVALAALALRRHLGTGDLTAAVATPLACIVALAPSDAAQVFVLFPVAVTTAVVVMLFARSTAARSVAAWSGVLALGMGLAAGTRFRAHDPIWIPIGLVAAAAWARGVMHLARRRGLPALTFQGVLQFGLVAWIWVLHAFTSLRDVRIALLDPMTVAGLVIALAAGHAAWSQRARLVGIGRSVLALWLVALALPVLAGHREMVAAVAGFSQVARDAWHVIYFASAGVLLAWIARGPGTARFMLRLGGLVVAGVAVLKTLADTTRTFEATPWTAAQTAAVLAASWGIAWLAGRRRREPVLVAFILLATSAFAYLMHAVFDHLPHMVPFLDLRLLLGLLSLAALASFPYRNLAPDVRRPTTTIALLGGLVLGFFVGAVELWQLVEPLSDAWPAVLMSVYMALFAAGTLAVGFLRKDIRLRYPALGLFGIVVLKVGLHDLAGAAVPLRIFVTGILGLVLLGAAFAYARRTTPPAASPPAATPPTATS